MATASFSPELVYHHHHRRDSASSNKSLSGRRPRLLRAYATEPSITTENSCRGLLTSPTYSSRRATELLSRVVISSSNSTTPTVTSSRNSVLDAGRLTETNHESCSCPPASLEETIKRIKADFKSKDSACYFSFPSFDTWEEERQRDEEKALEGRP